LSAIWHLIIVSVAYLSGICCC